MGKKREKRREKENVEGRIGERGIGEGGKGKGGGEENNLNSSSSSQDTNPIIVASSSKSTFLSYGTFLQNPEH